MVTMLLKQDLSEKDREGILEAVKKSFGKLNKEDLWGVRELSYPINHQEKAYYAHFEFESEPDTLSALDKSLKLNEDIIRYLIVRAKPLKKEKESKK